MDIPVYIPLHTFFLELFSWLGLSLLIPVMVTILMLWNHIFNSSVFTTVFSQHDIAATYKNRFRNEQFFSDVEELDGLSRGLNSTRPSTFWMNWNTTKPSPNITVNLTNVRD